MAKKFKHGPSFKFSFLIDLDGKAAKTSNKQAAPLQTFKNGNIHGEGRCC